MPTIGQITLVSDTTAYCKVHWGKTNKARGSCSFAVYIPTFPGEGWQARRSKAIAEAIQIAEAFLHNDQAQRVQGSCQREPLHNLSVSASAF